MREEGVRACALPTLPWPLLLADRESVLRAGRIAGHQLAGLQLHQLL
jgi:hypothetical protein